MRVVVVTMVYNEQANLPIWVNYYGRAVGYKNLLVVDHGSDDGALDAFPQIGRLHLPRSEFGELQRCRFISRLQHALVEQHDIVIYTDCDEILVPDPDKYGGLDAYLNAFARDAEMFRRPVGLNIFQSRSREPALQPWLPILQQRSYCQFHSLYCKPILTKSHAFWDVGFHNCDKPVRVDPDVYLFHLRDRDFEQSRRRLAVTRQMQWHTQDLERGWGYHHRYADPEFTQVRFDGPDRMLDANPALAFDFSREIASINEAFSDFPGPVAKIPERFKGIF